jgi:hypothetical protein
MTDYFAISKTTISLSSILFINFIHSSKKKLKLWRTKTMTKKWKAFIVNALGLANVGLTFLM